MHELYIALVIVGGLVLILGVFSDPIKNHLPLSSPLLALLVGVVLGPSGFDVLDPARWGDAFAILEEAARLTLGVGLMAIALRLPPHHYLDQWRPMAVMLGLVMPFMWITTGLLVYLILDLSWTTALLIGAILTPTDPIVASSVVTSTSAKELLPERIRHNLSGESGANDGLAYLFVFLPILLMTHTGDAPLQHWLTSTLLEEVGGALALGVVVGIGAGVLLVWSEKKEHIEKTSFLAYTVALSLLTLGGARLVGVNDLLAVFVAGIAFDNMVGGTERAEEADIQEAVNQFFALPIFALIGLVLPVAGWVELGGRGLLVVAAVLALRRLPAVVAVRSWMPPLDRLRDALFLGWFGPIGVSALFYAMLALHHVEDASIWHVSSLVICASIVAHGMTATPLTRRYAKAAAT